jgi:hypothetical protein
MYPSFILHHNFPSPASIGHKNLDGAHCLEFFPFALVCSIVYCHGPLCGSNPLSQAPIYCATQYFKTHYPCTPWYCAAPTSVATSSSNVLWQRLISHELVVSFDNYWVSCYHKQWPSNLHQHSANTKSLALYTPYKVRQIPWTSTRAAKTTCSQAPKRLSEKAHPTLGISIFFPTSRVRS